jgi:hypothetical protein
MWNKKYLLLVVALTCLALYFYGSYTKDNPYVQLLPTVGGLAFGLNTLIQIAQ